MDQSKFALFVKSNMDLLEGVHPESHSDLSRYEADLGFPLPPSMKWLLSTHGYSMACGVSNLEDSVKTTVECRRSIALPKDVFIINDWNDGGVIFAIVRDCKDAEYEILWGDAGDLHDYAEGKPMSTGIERFANYPEWVADRVRFERENV
jgi:hypothetical protein